MICFVTTRSHRYTHKWVTRWSDAPKVEIWSYDRLLGARSVPAATWVFTDFDRLGFWELELAAHIWRVLKAAGVRVLNDPARVRQRYALLRELHRTGLSCFNVWHVDSNERPEPADFPVFLRNAAAHRGVIGDLIADNADLESKIGDALAAGYPRRDLMIVQYAAEPVGGLFRKLSIFKIGERMVPALCVHQDHWCAKQGTRGIASPELYQEEHDIITGNPYAETLLPAFAAAEVDYGRADFAFSTGRLAVYEINTNPAIGNTRPHPSQLRLDAFALWRKQHVAALAGIDSSAGARIKIGGEILDKQRRRDFPMVRSRWMP